MQLQAGWGKIGIGVSLVLVLAGCTKPPSEEGVSDAEAAADYALNAVEVDASAVDENPCLSPWVIQGIKNNITERAGELLAANRGHDDAYQELINSASMEFSYISKPSEGADGAISCSAQANVTYLGNTNTSENIVSDVAGRINAGQYPSSFMGMGISAYDMGEFRSMSGNTFSTEVSYEISSSYSESGEESESYYAQMGTPAAMLATLVAFDKYMQDNAASAAAEKQRIAQLNEAKEAESAQRLAEQQRKLDAVFAKAKSSQQPAAEEVDLSAYEDSPDYPVDDDVVVVEEPAY